MIIGIVGPIKAGKETLAGLIRSVYGFSVLSFGNEVRLEARARGIMVQRKELQTLGFDLIQQFGESYWAERLIERIQPKTNYVVEGFRYLGQIERFRQQRSFKLIGITAPLDVLKQRYESETMGRPTEDTIPFEEAFKQDWNGLSNGQSTGECYASKDYEIINDTNNKGNLIYNLFKLMDLIS